MGRDAGAELRQRLLQLFVNIETPLCDVCRHTVIFALTNDTIGWFHEPCALAYRQFKEKATAAVIWT